MVYFCISAAGAHCVRTKLMILGSHGRSGARMKNVGLASNRFRRINIPVNKYTNDRRGKREKKTR